MHEHGNGHANGNGNGHQNGNGNGNGRKIGRPTKFSQETADALLRDLATGLTRRAACIRAGLHPSTITSWCDRKPSFSIAVQKAELDAYSEQKAALIEQALRTGNARSAAAAFARIGPSTFKTWLDLHPDFAARVEAAEAAAEVGHVANVLKAAADGSWQASAWWLERRRHAEWGKRDRVELEIKLAAARIAEQTGADPDWLIRRAEEIAAGAVATALPRPD